MRRAGLAIVLCSGLAACGGGSSGVMSDDTVAVKRAPVDGPGGCGVPNAWVVSEVAGVKLSRPSIMSPDLIRSLETWVAREARPIIGRKGGGLEELTVAAHYACRTRNSRPDARLSEHAKGNAIDISSFVLRDGSRISVLNGWQGRDSRTLRRLHASACGPFGTVLGPEADRFHQDHFHFDVARHRGGAYCR